ncbi:MAG: metalloregulator ArsR/SmtB family transcription factor, partial [Gemmatimonadaceae bacterium]|nr:metalloregulator ArsR/SmtB family transcription factor [Gemmatimonadaceae bacterium]
GLLEALRAAAEPTRLRLLAILAHGELTVTELTQLLGQSQPRISRHLRLLGDAGLLERVPEGAWVFYRLREHALVPAVLSLLPADDPLLVTDRARLLDVQRARQAVAESYFEAHAHEWDRIRSLYVSEAEVEQAILAAIGQSAQIGDLLDIGTGTGRILELLAPRASRAVGIDRSPAMLGAARPAFADPALRHVQLRQGDMYRLPIADASVDLAVLHQVLHYADDPATALREVARVLRPGGRVLVVDFAPHTLEFLRTEHAHRRLGFATDEVRVWCAAAGLQLREAARLAGDPLTVVLWEASRPVDRVQQP